MKLTPIQYRQNLPKTARQNRHERIYVPGNKLQLKRVGLHSYKTIADWMYEKYMLRFFFIARKHNLRHDTIYEESKKS